MICPPDVLCRWIKEEERWETMEELAIALEHESLKTIRQAERIQNSKIRIGLRRLREIRKFQQQLENERAVERMMALAAPRKSRYAA